MTEGCSGGIAHRKAGFDFQQEQGVDPSCQALGPSCQALGPSAGLWVPPARLCAAEGPEGCRLLLLQMSSERQGDAICAGKAKLLLL